MATRAGLVTLHGKPVTLVGDEVREGDLAPDATLLDNDLRPVRLSTFRGRVCVLSAVPSLDTPVCDRETRRFNEEAGRLGGNVAIVTISVDLPFAQKRWCGAAGIANVITLSDYRDLEFGTRFGVLIEELRLLARCVFVLDRGGRVALVELVKEVSSEPDYDAVLGAVRRLL